MKLKVAVRAEGPTCVLFIIDLGMHVDVTSAPALDVSFSHIVPYWRSSCKGVDGGQMD